MPAARPTGPNAAARIATKSHVNFAQRIGIDCNLTHISRLLRRETSPFEVKAPGLEPRDLLIKNLSGQLSANVRFCTTLYVDASLRLGENSATIRECAVVFVD